MNTKAITPITIWKDGEEVLAECLQLVNFHDYNFDGSDSKVVYRLVKMVSEEDIDGNAFIAYETLLEGLVTLPNDLVSQWGEDDEPIFDYVMTALNITEA